MQKIPIRRIASITEEQVSSGSFNIRSVQALLGGKEMVQELHRHSFFFVLALQKGKGVHEIDFTRYEVRDNSIFILRPGQVHRLELKAGSDGYLMAFDTAFYYPKDITAQQRLKKATSKNYCNIQADNFKKLIAVLNSVFNEFTSKQQGWAEVIKANLDIFFIEFIRQSTDTSAGSKNGGDYSQERFEELQQLLETNIADLKNVSEYAQRLNLSAYQLNAITKSIAGKTTSELINEQIILEAKRYLLATPNQIKDIADHLGYEDVSYFIRFFKKHAGHSPEAFRKKFK